MNTAFEIDELSALSPDMSDAELQNLAQSIRAIGQQIPILVWQGKIIDGRKRLAACRAVGVEPIITVLLDDAPATQLAADINLMRTHYSASQRAMYAAKVAGLRSGRPEGGKGANFPPFPGGVRERSWGEVRSVNPHRQARETRREARSS